MKKILSIAALSLALATGANANSIAFQENFDGDYSVNFPTILELDHHMPVYNVQSIFQNSEGVSMPWWHVKDAAASNDRFLGSHAIYNPVGASNDWCASRAIDIPTTGYELTFDAQSCPFRTDSQYWLSSLHVFISLYNIDAEYQPEPEEAALFIEEVPYGKSVEVNEGDFTSYSLNLDKYAGKKIYLIFANLNNDKDILLIDNVLIQRKDNVNITAEAEEMVVKGKHAINVNIETTENVSDWKLTLADKAGNIFDTVEGEALAANSNLDYQLEYDIEGDRTLDWIVTFEAKDILPITQTGTVKALTFEPYHRVIVEEATGLWCGNCPMGAYNMEAMTTHEDTRDFTIPVSVHITGGVDDLVNLQYAYLLGMTYAPAYRVNREFTARGFSTEYDIVFNPKRENSFAKLLVDRHNQLTTLDVDLHAEFLPIDGETKKIKLDATVTPAISIDNADYRIAFIMKENNVDGKGSPLMWQHNYYSGVQVDGMLGGWTGLPDLVTNAIYHDVAREIWDFNGIENSLPKSLKADQPVTFSYTVDIPNTYIEGKYQNITCVSSPAIVPENITMVAMVLDENFEVINSVAFPMTEAANERNVEFLTASVDTIDIDNSAAAVEYYDLQGRRIQNPDKGIYIRRQGNATTKVVL